MRLVKVIDAVSHSKDSTQTDAKEFLDAVMGEPVGATFNLWNLQGDMGIRLSSTRRGKRPAEIDFVDEIRLAKRFGWIREQAEDKQFTRHCQDKYKTSIRYGQTFVRTASTSAIKEQRERSTTILGSVTLNRLLDRTFWERLNFIAKVVPDSQLLPARTVFSEKSGAEDTNIGLNPLFSSSRLWFTGPDLANAVLYGHAIKIVKAIRLDPIGIQDGLAKRIRIGNRIINPRKDNPYVAWVEEKEVTQGEKRNFIKCLLCSGVYGLAVELNRKRFSKNNPQRIRIWAGEKELPPITSTEYEEPGKWCFPWVGSLVTGGGRLLLGILEKEVLVRGGSFLMTDTDSMAVIATEHGGLIP
jgi:hypothetical protein